MNHIKAIGFDLFNTLITVEPGAVDEAMNRLTSSLRQSGLAVEHDLFIKVHRENARRFLEETRKDGKETHNRFWISAALEALGHHIRPDDSRIAVAVEAYFSAFYHLCHLIPGTGDMLGTLREQYALGLLSNFTHAPAAKKIIHRVGLRPFFDAVLISGELGYRKPHPLVFQQLIEKLGVKKQEVLYVGDDPDSDITGSQRAGLQPVWTTYVHDQNLTFTPNVLPGHSEMTDSKVPRISSWNDLLALLDIG